MSDPRWTVDGNHCNECGTAIDGIGARCRDCLLAAMRRAKADGDLLIQDPQTGAFHSVHPDSVFDSQPEYAPDVPTTDVLDLLTGEGQ